jgi:hypothetical protein
MSSVGIAILIRVITDFEANLSLGLEKLPLLDSWQEELAITVRPLSFLFDSCLKPKAGF